VKTRPFGREARIVIYKCLMWNGFALTRHYKCSVRTEKTQF